MMPTGIIAEVEAYAAAHGVGINIELDEGDSSFHVPDIGRNDVTDPTSKGYGLKTLALLIERARSIGYSVDIEYMADEPRLGELYESLGFREYSRGEIVALRWQA